MSGIVQRCAACGAATVVQRRDRGRSVRCPKCGAGIEVPQNLDFVPVENATARDRERAGWLLVATIVAGVGCCLPASAFIWWSASGHVRRARDAGREVEPLLASTAVLAGVLAIIDLAGWALVILSRVS